MSAANQPYPDVPVRADYPAIERRVLRFWEDDGTFPASVAARPADDAYLFFDGPPFANGLPHYGHLLTGYVKDVVPRYQTMKGKRVERRFGWDCHGLPAEMESEKELGVSGRRAIMDYGIDRFNDHCRTSVLRFTREWQDYVTRQARWVDFDNDYKTMDVSYMESVMWAFQQLWAKGLVYEAYRVMPYSWGAQTPLSNFEIRLDDATRPRQDPAVTVLFELEPHPDDPGHAPMKILAWTTTPWTLPSNLALAVAPDMDYAVMEEDGVHYVLGAGAVERYAKELEAATRVGTLKGSDLVGRTYKPLFPYFAGHRHGFQVLAADFIDDAEGTGVVHMAPGFGEDDQRVCEENQIELVVPVDDEGRFTDDVPDYVGLNVFDANAPIIRRLRDEGSIVRHETYVHNYPHCWRTDTPIIYRAVSSWYVEVTAFKDRLLETNQEINWIPGHVRDGAFGRWLEGARDWSISRNRFWGAPIPVWRSDDPAHPRIDVYGSIAELEADFGVTVTDLHRPFVDDLVRPNPDDPSGRSMMRRVPEVLDCWFESGSMPFAQAHYPFENRSTVEDHTADFIVEYIAQTRGWFYTMHVLSVALFDRAAFQNCICHGVVLDEDGRKLSKRLRNYPDPVEVFETIGSDALRWFLMASPILRGGDLRIDRDGTGIQDAVRLVLNPIWNTWHFLALYANVEGYRPRWRTDSAQLLDRYILAKTRELVDKVQGSFDAYEIAEACTHVTAFLDALTNWYVRRSRDRFWGQTAEGSGPAAADAVDAFDTLHTVLHVVARVTAPLLPYLCEDVYQGLTGERSVHLADWPDAAALPEDRDLVAAMDKVREVCSAALSLREGNGLRVRLPLQRLTVAGRAASQVRPFVELIEDELNVKAVELTEDVASVASFVLRPNTKVLGPKLGADVQKVVKAAREGAWSAEADGTVSVAGQVLQSGEFELALTARGDAKATAALRGNDTVVDLDVELTPELRAEGTARDLIRLVQQARKDADLHVADRIELVLQLPPAVREAVTAHQGALAEAVLATDVRFSDEAQTTAGRLDGEPIAFSIAKRALTSGPVGGRQLRARCCPSTVSRAASICHAVELVGLRCRHLGGERLTIAEAVRRRGEAARITAESRAVLGNRRMCGAAGCETSEVSDNRALILDQFTRQAGPFASAPGIRNERSLRLVVETTGAGPTDRTLDVACGPGLLACAFAEVAAHASGIDLVPAMIAQAEARQAELGLDNVSWQVGDVDPLPFDDDAFDVVTCRYAFHHFPRPDAVLAEMARVCRPGGRVAVIDVAASPDAAKAATFNEMEVRRDPSHVRALPLEELRSLFAGVGLADPTLTTYLLESDLDGLLSRSFPEPGDEDKVRAAIVGTVDDDRLGVPARRDGDRVVLGYPIAVLTVEV